MNPFHLGAALFVLSGKRHLGVVPFLVFCVWFTLFAGLILAIAWGGGPRGPMPSIAEVHRQARDFVNGAGVGYAVDDYVDGDHGARRGEADVAGGV